MPTPREVFLYQLGIRLGMCRNLHVRLTHYSDTGPDDVAVLNWAIRSLGQAFSEFAVAADLAEPQVKAAKALISGSKRLWKRWARLPVEQLFDIGDEDWKFLDMLDRLDELVRDAILSMRRVSTWFLLGKQIVDGQWHHPRVRPGEVHKQGGSEPQWLWVDEKELKQLLRSTKFKLEQLFPMSEGRHSDAKTLPYHGGKYKPWQRVEIGLANLLKSVDRIPAAASDQAQPDTAQHSDPSKIKDDSTVALSAPLALNPLQKAILEALNKKSLKKLALSAACGVEGTRLYRNNGIKEMMDRGIVAKQCGYGYYRPDAPLPEMMILDAKQEPH